MYEHKLYTYPERSKTIRTRITKCLKANKYYYLTTKVITALIVPYKAKTSGYLLSTTA